MGGRGGTLSLQIPSWPLCCHQAVLEVSIGRQHLLENRPEISDPKVHGMYLPGDVPPEVLCIKVIFI